MDVNEHERLSNITLVVVRKDIDVNEHERLSNITLIHKLEKRNSFSKKGYRCKLHERLSNITLRHKLK